MKVAYHHTPIQNKTKIKMVIVQLNIWLPGIILEISEKRLIEEKTPIIEAMARDLKIKFLLSRIIDEDNPQTSSYIPW